MSKTKEEFGEEDDHRIILQINRISSSGAEQLLNTKKPFSKHTPSAILLTKSSSKSEDSLDSGVYTRQKSNDSIDSLDSNESGVNGVQRECSAAPCPEILTPTNEAIPPLPIQQYEDYMREVQDIRQSIIVKNQEEGKQTVSRSNSGDDPEDDNEADWFRRAGLSDLVITSSASMMADSQGNPASPNAGGDNFSSMTVLSTLTRPQREAVLRRITSFNRAQKTKRRPKLAITAVFPDVSMDVKPSENGDTPNTPKLKKPDELALKSTSLHHDNSGGRDYTDSRYQRRHSEISSVMHKQDESPSPVSPGNHMKMDYRPKHKKSVQSVVATNPATGIETLSISPHGNDTASWSGSREELSMHSPLEGNKNQDKSMSYSETAKQESLPNFSLVKDKLGITKISDVSPIDLRKVQTLALIELTALFDMRNIDLKRRKLAKTKPKDSGVLGVPLTTLVEWDRKKTNDPNLCVPLVLRKIISFLETNALKDEGILRKSGSATRTKLLKQAIDSQFGTSNIQDSSSSVASFDWSDAYPNDVAAILKEFLRGLPEPLLTTQYIDAIQSCGLIPDRKQQLQALNLLIILLNEVHRSSLKVLLQFLGKVVAAEAWNKMSLNNVAVIIAPNLFLNKKGSKRESSNTSQDLKHAAGTSNIVRMLIKYQKLLWAIPAFMLIQVRNMNRAEMSSKKHSHTSKEKYKGFFRGRGKEASKKLITRGPLQAFDYETPLGLVRIQAPNMNLTSMAVQMDGQITAGDILARYQRQCGRMRQSSFENLVEEVTNETHALYEVGGNIHERCLDPDANLSAILQVNPDATWFIRARVAD